MKAIRIAIVFLILTAVTQIGGVLYLICRYCSISIFNFKRRSWLKRQALFVVIYILMSMLVLPSLAQINNRQPLPILTSDVIQPQNWFTVLANRHYVSNELYDLITNVAITFNANASNKGLKINYLDANFPFMDGFPLLPHLSHNDGKKLDLAFRYSVKNDLASRNKTRSLFGYGVYVKPNRGEINQTTICKEKSWMYDMTKYVGIPTNQWLSFDKAETKRLMNLLVKANTSKIFIEPNLKERMKLNSPKIRFHGCHAVRHDDHIHIQIE